MSQIAPQAPFFSAVIAAYNSSAYIADCLRSVEAQTFRDFEVIVVDDGSTDDTAAIAASFAGVQVIRQGNQGPGPARNAGAAAARGRYLAFLDSDDLWLEWTLATFHCAIEQAGVPMLLAGSIDEVALDSAPASSQCALECEQFEHYLASSGRGYFVGSCMMVVAREAFLQSKGFWADRAYAEDMDLALRLGAAPGFVKILSPTTLIYRRHAMSARGNWHRLAEGLARMVARERANKYPGGTQWRRARLTLLTLFLRPAALDLLRAGAGRAAWGLYWGAFRWHMALGRWKFLCGFPALAMWALWSKPDR